MAGGGHQNPYPNQYNDNAKGQRRGLICNAYKTPKLYYKM